jgi:carbon-monoxide dehydrogenase medium subunit
MIPFEMAEPASLAEAIGLLDPQDPTVRAVAGGTALMLMMKAGVFAPARLVCLHKIEAEHARISVDGGGAMRIGAMATLRELERAREIGARLPMLTHTLRRLSNPRVRNVARVGGALAHGDPHMDLPPALIALNAVISVSGPKAQRTLPLHQLYAGYYETVLAKNELITAVTVPAQSGRRSAYMKVTARSADDWPSLGVAVSFAFEHNTMRDPVVVVSAATEKVARLPDAETVLDGAAVDDAVLARAGEAAAAEASILADAHGSAAYKRELLRVYVKRAVRRALDGYGGALQ